MKKKLVLVVLVLVLAMSLALVACGDPTEPTPEVHNITFYFLDANGTTKTVAFDENFSDNLPTVPDNGYLVFDRWYTDAACTDGNEWTVPETLDADLILYGKWKNVSVTFDSQNGTDPKAVVFNASFKLPKTPSNGNLMFQGWYTDAACTSGNEWSIPEKLSTDITVYAKWHEHNYGDNYLLFTQCLSGCGTIGRAPSTDVAKESFIFDFDESKKEAILADYDALLADIEAAEDTAVFEELWYKFDDDIGYVGEQYQIAYVFYCTYNKPAQEEAYDDVSEFYDELVTMYYKLYQIVYDSDYRDFFYEGWTEEEIEQALIMSASYGSDEYLNIQKQIDDLLLDYDKVSQTNNFASTFSEMYAQLVSLNNQMAALAGYDNYMEYAYENRYERYYTPEEAAQMRGYVKQYIAPLFGYLYNKYQSTATSLKNADKDFYSALSSASVFKNTNASQTAVNYVVSYLKQMTKTDSAKEINFFEEANLLFKNGNYYTGKQSGAFSYYIRNRDTTILYFSNEGGGADYQNAFTFLHEFGHYYNNIYNGGLSLSMDQKETHSQGDEMLFLAWLYNNKAKDITSGYDALMSYQLVNMVFSVVLPAAVDEFEYAAYTGSYEGEPLPLDAQGNVDYHKLFSNVLRNYSPSFLSTFDYSGYWYKTTFHQAGYYISYAMSALPSLEIYVQAMEDYDAAKAGYLKLFTFSDDPTMVSTSETGYRSVLKDYDEILTYCGFKTPFDEEMYINIAEFFGV